MGYEKNRRIEEDEQGWRYSGGTEICWRCLSDKYLRSYVKASAKGFSCDFCKRSSRKYPNTVRFDEIMQIISSAVHTRYNDANNETIPWDDEDHCFAGTTYTSYEIVHYNIPTPSENDAVLDHIVESLPDHEWCQRHFASLSHQERYESSWESFCTTVKHQTRYLFLQQTPDPHDDGIPVADMLDELGEVILSHGMLTTLPTGTQFVRVRVHQRDEDPATPPELGPPPPNLAVSSRMSPAGISLFYAATHDSTARAETFGLNPATVTEYGTIARWTTTRPLLVLDLTKRLEMPSFYVADETDYYDEAAFLDSFIADITKPIERDGREHIEYVPTQIVTEYLRTTLRTPDNQRLDGIMYPSARTQGKCFVLFLGYDQLHPTYGAGDGSIVLDAASVRRTQTRRRRTIPQVDLDRSER